MSGTRAGGLKAKKKNLAKDKGFYRTIGSVGGAISRGGGFVDKRSWWQKLTRKPTRAQLAGRIGGRLSKRGPAK